MKIQVVAHVYRDGKDKLQEAFDITVVGDGEKAEDVAAAYKLTRDELDRSEGESEE